MTELLDILVQEPIIDYLNKVVKVECIINYEGNTFTAWGSARYYAGFEEPDTEFAIIDAQDNAIRNAKKLAGLANK